MDRPIHLIVDSGPERGREISIPMDGVRIGRSTRNDVVVNDPAMSRFHCRIFFKPGQGLWVTDLGSANETLVNDAVVQESQVRVGDQIAVGTTVFRVVSDKSPESAAEAGATVAAAALKPISAPGESAVDLGLERKVDAGVVRTRRRRLVWLAVCMALVTVLAWMPKDRLSALFEKGMKWFGGEKAAPKLVADLPILELSYERVQATSSNIFRYAMQITRGMLVVQVDDLETARHVRREKKVDTDLLRSLAKSIDSAGFFDLLDVYRGLAPEIFEGSDLSVTIGARAHRTRVINHADPEIFAATRGMVEEFGKNELGLAALAIEPEKLVEKARESLLQAQKLYDEKDVRNSNLAGAIQALKELEWYLETIEPKPDFYADAMSKRTDWIRELQEKYDNLWFLAERAVKLRDWNEAAKHLRVVCEIVPDRSDERNRNALRKLLEVERHLATQK